MNIFGEYINKRRTPEEAVRVIRPGDWVDYTMGHARSRRRNGRGYADELDGSI